MALILATTTPHGFSAPSAYWRIRHQPQQDFPRGADPSPVVLLVDGWANAGVVGVAQPFETRAITVPFADLTTALNQIVSGRVELDDLRKIYYRALKMQSAWSGATDA